MISLNASFDSHSDELRSAGIVRAHRGKPRILILSASVGSGHIRAGKAVELALAGLLPEATIAHVDVLDLTNSAFRKAYGAGYFRAARSAPRLVGWMYDFLDEPDAHGMATATRQFFERINFTRLSRLLTEQHWDLAICTHFLPEAFIARMRRRDIVHFPQVVVVTDFDVHGLWVNRPCEKFFVATDECRANIAQGGDGNDISVTGIPIDPVFSEPLDRIAPIRQLELNTDRPIVLQLAAGFSLSSVERIHRAILQIPRPLQIVVVAGRNAEAADAVKSIDHDPRHIRRIFGFTNRMHELLRAADFAITKPGGLTTAESLASGCPMVIAEPIPGQEDRNADFLLENNCAVKVNNLYALNLKLKSLLDDPGRLATMRCNALRCARPHAALDVAAQCVQLLNQRAVLV
jgi:processive 1,2-diacylglycerol beta-glucosyltransferase